jgi:hypothetical protein
MNSFLLTKNNELIFDHRFYLNNIIIVFFSCVVIFFYSFLYINDHRIVDNKVINFTIYAILVLIYYYIFIRFSFYNRKHRIIVNKNKITLNDNTSIDVETDSVRFVVQYVAAANGIVSRFCVCYFEYGHGYKLKKYYVAGGIGKNQRLKILDFVSRKLPNIPIEIRRDEWEGRYPPPSGASMNTTTGA